MLGAVLVRPEDEVMLISTGGVLIRTLVEQVRELGRATQGVRLINLDDGTLLAGIEKVVEAEIASDGSVQVDDDADGEVAAE